MNEIERENNFKEWLRTVVDNQAPISSYLNALKFFEFNINSLIPIPDIIEKIIITLYINFFFSIPKLPIYLLKAK